MAVHLELRGMFTVNADCKLSGRIIAAGQLPEGTVLYNIDVASLGKLSSQSEPSTTGTAFVLN